MGAIMNGLALHGGLRVYGGTFLVFMDYMRNAVRLAALMGVPAIYVFTHDSIGLGEDGPTHQPVEQIANLRGTPNICVWRPCDTVETAAAWREALARGDGPTALVLSRQNLPHQERSAAQVEAISREEMRHHLVVGLRDEPGAAVFPGRQSRQASPGTIRFTVCILRPGQGNLHPSLLVRVNDVPHYSRVHPIAGSSRQWGCVPIIISCSEQGPRVVGLRGRRTFQARGLDFYFDFIDDNWHLILLDSK